METSAWRFIQLFVALLALAGCSMPSAPIVFAPATAGITLVAPTAAPTSTLGSVSTLVPTTALTIQAQPATQTPEIPIVDRVKLIRDQQSFRLEARTGQLVILNWLDATHALIYWSLSVGSKPDAMNATYLIDLIAGRLDRLAMNIGEPQAVVPNSRFAVLLWSGSMTVDIVDIRSGEAQTIFARDPALPQWVLESSRRRDFDLAPSIIAAAWVGRGAFVLTLARGEDRGAPDWGKLLLIDVPAQRVRLLAEQGQFAAALPDGGLLVRHGWVDGDVQMFNPPYSEPPTTIAPGGPWTWGWAVSPDARRVAWQEWAPPPGDWSHRLPHACCSGDPHPIVRTLVIWDRVAGQVQRFPVSGLRWPQDTYLRWRRDRSAILFAGTSLDHPEHTALFQITLKGKIILLVRHEWVGNLFVDYERRNGSLYYVIGGRDGQNDGQLMRRYPDGRLEELCGGIPLPCSVDEHGLLISKKHDLTIFQDLLTGAIRREAAPQDAQLSPTGQWSIRGSSDSTLLISRIK